jgi:hypothetical protein
MTEPTNDNQSTEAAADEEAQMRQARALLIQRLTEELSKPNPRASLLAVAAKFLEDVKPPPKPKPLTVTRLPFPADNEEAPMRAADNPQRNCGPLAKQAPFIA